MSVEDIASQSSVVFEIQYTVWLKGPNFWGRCFPSSAGTLVRRGGITNHHSIACLRSNISAKNYHNQLMCIEVIVCRFYATQCNGKLYKAILDCGNCGHMLSRWNDSDMVTTKQVESKFCPVKKWHWWWLIDF